MRSIETVATVEIPKKVEARVINMCLTNGIVEPIPSRNAQKPVF